MFTEYMSLLKASQVGEHPLVESLSIDPGCSFHLTGENLENLISRIEEIKVNPDKIFHRCCN